MRAGPPPNLRVGTALPAPYVVWDYERGRGVRRGSLGQAEQCGAVRGRVRQGVGSDEQSFMVFFLLIHH